MEDLKPLDKVIQPDPRLGYFGHTLEYIHRRATGISINDAAPESVRNQFTIARGALVYSWFFYPFLSVAFLYSILAVELALRVRLEAIKPELFKGAREPTLFPLLVHALQQRWITDAGFALEDPDNVSVPEKIARQFPKIPADQRYSYLLLDALVDLRNDLAHGEYMLIPNTAPLLDRAAEIINQLFPTKPDDGSANKR